MSALASASALAAQPADSATVSAPAADAADTEPVLDASKLHCYQVALDLHQLCCTLTSPLSRVTRDQLERASLSIVLNIAEAAGRRSRRSKAYFFMTARGSATETAALLDVLALRRLAPPQTLRTARRLAIRIVQMLTRVHQRLS